MRGVKGTLECGTFAGYTHGCRCLECRIANADHQRDLVRRDLVVREERAGRYCLICGIALVDHPMRACWRWAAGR